MLCEAETLRRLRRPAAARPLLREALAIFEGLGARPWAARGETELAATGARPGARPAVRSTGGDVDLDVLTPQEFQIARTVAEGLNNAEAAAALFVSRKTVEAHLTRVYRKLEVRSRTELARRFAPVTANPDGAWTGRPALQGDPGPDVRDPPPPTPSSEHLSTSLSLDGVLFSEWRRARAGCRIHGGRGR